MPRTKKLRPPEIVECIYDGYDQVYVRPRDGTDAEIAACAAAYVAERLAEDDGGEIAPLRYRTGKRCHMRWGFGREEGTSELNETAAGRGAFEVVVCHDIAAEERRAADKAAVAVVVKAAEARMRAKYPEALYVKGESRGYKPAHPVAVTITLPLLADTVVWYSEDPTHVRVTHADEALFREHYSGRKDPNADHPA